jgi:hypothetical protein
MARVIRWFVGNFHGVADCTLGFGGINQQSVVLVAASEGDSGDSTASPQRFIGDATFQVDNIAPFDGGVKFRLNILWDSPLNVWADIVIMDEFPQGFVRSS